MNFDIKVKKQNPGLCRCCLSEGCYKDLGTEYTWMNENEIYADMLLECFDISITQHTDGPNGNNRLICEVCVVRLRDACNFKKQVLASERKFVDMIACGQFQSEVIKYQAGPGPVKKQLKEESPSDNGDVEYLDDMDSDDNSPMNQVKQSPKASVVDVSSSLKVKTKRERPIRPKRPVKPETKPKVPRMEVKPHSSKPDVKELQIRAIKPELQMLTKALVNISTATPFRFSRNRFLCFYCCVDFYESSDLLAHTKTEHGDYKLDDHRVKDLTRHFTDNPTIKLDITELACKLCKEELREVNDFINHLSEKHELHFNKDISKYVYSFKLNNELNCLQCGEKFQFFGPLLRHVNKYHNQLSPFLCEICGKGFVSQKAVDKHVKLSHNNAGKFPCTKCKEVYPSLAKLSTHTENVHRSYRFRCWKCSEKFPSRYMKKRHLAIVHDVKNFRFPCPECNMLFFEKGRLLNHQQKVHAKEKNVTCHICGFKGYNASTLKRHLISHSEERPFECDYCKKTFQRKKTLLVHVRIHENDRRHVCEECGKAFVQVTSLRVHCKTHHSASHK